MFFLQQQESHKLHASQSQVTSTKVFKLKIQNIFSFSLSFSFSFSFVAAFIAAIDFLLEVQSVE